MKLLFSALSLLLCLPALADEGMWMPGNLGKEARRTLKELGLQLPVDQLYDPRKPSLKDAVVSFGGFCSGVVVSEDGLVMTNHHCGFSSVQQHSTVEHDYLKHGFVASTRADELPNPDLFVRFLVRTEDVTRRVLDAVRPGMSESERAAAIDSVSWLIGTEVSRQDTTLLGTVDAYYSGNEYWLSVYRDFHDVRLVFAPPSSVGKFGWERDNWEWPRHTGDFCVFRIYAGRDNRPAPYSPDNVPYHPRYVASISLDGYHEGSFCMTLGYPGATERYLSSYGIEEMLHGSTQAQIDVRGIKQAIWKRAMERDDGIRIKYASKYDESSNYWKNSIGVKRAVRRLRVLDRKRGMERELACRIERDSDAAGEYAGLLPALKRDYAARSRANRAQAYFVEAFFNGPELVQQALSVLNFDFEGEHDAVVAGLRAIVSAYADMDIDTDKEVFAAMLGTYRAQVDSLYLPGFYHTIDTAYAGNARAYVDSLYARTQLATPRGLQRFLERDTTYHIYEDPAVDLCIDLLTKFFEMGVEMQSASTGIARGERQLNAAIRRFYSPHNFYPDANSTLRLSFGTVCGYRPFDGAYYNYYTTTEGILQKARAHWGDPDFEVQPELLALLASKDFGRYADREDGGLKVCFISNNDITGGNSGSAMFNARGELLGLAFDGNWEAMSSDLLYEPRTQRCIGVDVRYILFLMERYGGAAHLVEELKISRSR